MLSEPICIDETQEAVRIRTPDGATYIMIWDPRKEGMMVCLEKSPDPRKSSGAISVTPGSSNSIYVSPRPRVRGRR